MINTKSFKLFSTILLATFLSCFIASPSFAAKPDAKVFFISPKDNAQVKSPVTFEFGVEGMIVHPAGDLIEGTGHHHLIIDGAPIPAGSVVPANETNIHFGKGQTSAVVPLSVGKHTVTMQFADGAHRSYGPELSATITVNVVP